MSDSDSPVDVDIPDDALCLVACGKSKIRTYDEDLERHVPVPADQLYTSSYAVVKRNLALTCEDHRILSAEHGIVAPDHLLEYYDTKMGDVPDSEFDAETPGTLAWKIEQSLTRWSEQYDDPTIMELARLKPRPSGRGYSRQPLH
jgi:hypothetical protein